MSTIINTYPVFENSQVLTSAQLNQLVSYLDQQTRLTRAKLIGMGIVCGLKISFAGSGANPTVTISKGTAITSEGFLIAMGECETRYYRPYTLPEGVTYKPFGHPTQDVTLFELLKDMPEDPTDVKTLGNPLTFLNNKFVILFLECFDNDLKSCLGKTCDDLGIDRIFTVRKLLINKTDLDKVLTRSANTPVMYPAKFDLPEISMPRALFISGSANSQDYTAFSQTFANTFRTTVYPALFGSGSAAGALSQTYTIYEPLLRPEYGTNPFASAIVNTLKSAWTNFFSGTTSPAYQGIQYFYDFLKDLSLAYNEFRQCAFDLVSVCCPDMSLFPRHVMLGRANTTLETKEEARDYRHGFVQPPIYNQQRYLIAKTVSLHKRLVVMVEKFNLALISSPAGTVQVRITPSNEKQTPLAGRSIPYYYKSKETSTLAGGETLEYYWNFDYTRMKNIGVPVNVVSYENQATDQSVIGTRFTTPLYYNIDSDSFLRIEGHIAKNAPAVAATLDGLKKSFNLPFDTVLLQLDPNAGSVTLDYDHGFEDLQEEYAFHKSIFCGYVRDITNLFEYVTEHAGDPFFDGHDMNAELEELKKIVEPLKILCKMLPECLHDFNFAEFTSSYKILMQNAIDYLLVYKKLLNEIHIGAGNEENIPTINGLIQRVSPIILRFLDLWFFVKFYRLYYSFKRREYYLRSVSAVFSGYIGKHPGVEHLAGVYKGGTFILLYNNSAEKKVIADFSLPYQSCCLDIPMCAGADFEYKPLPFAKPDYAITIVDVPVEIDVMINDTGLFDGNYQIDFDTASEEGGSIALVSGNSLLQYKPKGGYSGFDKFKYRLKDTDTGMVDTGVVTILVKEPVVQEGCYSVDILVCWNGDNDYLKNALKNRGLDTSGNVNELASRLLKSLRISHGFTEQELASGVLVNPTARAQLVQCADLFDNDYNYPEQAQRLRDYQNANCGPAGGCTVTVINGRVLDSTGRPFPGANITVKGTTIGTITDVEGRFRLDVGVSGRTIRVQVIGYFQADVFVCKENVIEIIMIPSARIDINFALIEEVKVLAAIAEARRIKVPTPPDRDSIIAALNRSEDGNKLNRDEFKFLTKDMLGAVLKSKRIEFTTNDTKDDLINRLFA